jgi:CBS domain-containing protein
VIDAVRDMNEQKVGSIVVLEDGQFAGVFTEREALRKVVAAGLDPASTPVSQVMSREDRTIAPTATIEEAMRIMSEKRIRYLVVQSNGRVLGVVSNGDITRLISGMHQTEAEYLRDYISGSYPG